MLLLNVHLWPLCLHTLVLNCWIHGLLHDLLQNSPTTIVLKWCISALRRRKVCLQGFEPLVEPQCTIQYTSTTTKYLLHYGSADSFSTFKDTLCMHNTLMGYVYLLNGLGCVWFAGASSASHEEVNCIIAFAKEITPLLNSTKRSK
jgi:hypothetical protein